MPRLRDRALRSQCLIDKTPHGHWQTTTLSTGSGITGMRCSTVVDGAVNGDLFEALVEQVSSPGLKPGDVVVMDNLSSHKRQRVRQFIECIGAVLRYLPPCSPDLNPTELTFSESKQRLRSLATRTKGVLWQSMQAVLTAVTPSAAVNCFRHAGHTLRVQ